jgi:hypothetical protein
LAGATSSGGATTFSRADLREWLTYIASDDLQGRALFSPGLDQAAAYIGDHLRAWGVRPAGDSGSYFQTVHVLSVKATSRSTVTVQIGGETKTFADGHGVTFQKNAGAPRRVMIDRVEFAGYGLDIPAAHHVDLGAWDLRGAAVVWLGAEGPKEVDAETYRLLLGQRGRSAVEQARAAASIGPDLPPADPPLTEGGSPGGRAGARSSDEPALVADFSTTERLDKPRPPIVGASDEFFEFLFSHAPIRFEELKRRAASRAPLPAFRLEGVTLTFNLDVDYAVVHSRSSQNIVATVEGSDPALRHSFVAFGAHYDHVGYADGEIVASEHGPQRQRAPGRVSPGALDDRIWNGADDDGSGTVGLMALARAFAGGSRPRRSLLFVWHTGEETGRYGSLYFADHPAVPLSDLLGFLNIDMIGRNRDNKSTESNTVYLVGADRISSELDQIARVANLSLVRPMNLDFSYNDPSDPESLYTRSDHYSYGSRGIPVIFFTTGLHPDYHANTDEVSRIEFDKLARILDLVYEIGTRLANLDHPLRLDKGVGGPAVAAAVH